jgi:hypothetical protein
MTTEQVGGLIAHISDVELRGLRDQPCLPAPPRVAGLITNHYSPLTTNPNSAFLLHTAYYLLFTTYYLLRFLFAHLSEISPRRASYPYCSCAKGSKPAFSRAVRGARNVTCTTPGCRPISIAPVIVARFKTSGTVNERSSAARRRPT